MIHVWHIKNFTTFSEGYVAPPYQILSYIGALDPPPPPPRETPLLYQMLQYQMHLLAGRMELEM